MCYEVGEHLRRYMVSFVLLGYLYRVEGEMTVTGGFWDIARATMRRGRTLDVVSLDD